MPARCRVFGHRFRFTATDAVMSWQCQREGCTASGEKLYPSAETAERYAAALDREDRDKLGRRAPLFGLFPLRIWRRIVDRGQRGGGPSG
ncbi:MAG: hypothetical protein ACRDMJ_00010 [Solirubrobacteraceae bacterium]